MRTRYVMMTINVCLPYPSYSYICFSAIYVHESVMQEHIQDCAPFFCPIYWQNFRSRNEEEILRDEDICRTCCSVCVLV